MNLTSLWRYDIFSSAVWCHVDVSENGVSELYGTFVIFGYPILRQPHLQNWPWAWLRKVGAIRKKLPAKIGRGGEPPEKTHKNHRKGGSHRQYRVGTMPTNDGDYLLFKLHSCAGCPGGVLAGKKDAQPMLSALLGLFPSGHGKPWRNPGIL